MPGVTPRGAIHPHCTVPSTVDIGLARAQQSGLLRGVTMTRWMFIVLLSGLAATPGCREKTEETASPVDAGEQDAGIAAKARKIDRGLAKAVESASRSDDTASPTKQGGPPESGVFDPAEADRELPAGQAAKVTVGALGGEPRVQLGAAPRVGASWRATLKVALNVGQLRGLPPLEFALTFSARAPKPAARDAAQSAGAAATGSKAGGADVTARVDRAEVSAAGRQIPADLAKQVAQLKGSTVQFHMGPSGAATDVSYQLAKNADGTWDLAGRALADALALSLVPFPDQALGVGGYFMAVTRGQVSGISVLNYRMVKVDKLSDGQATLSLNGRHYATDKSFNLPEATQGRALQFDRLNVRSDGTLEIAAGQPFPMSSELGFGISALLVPAEDAASAPAASEPDPRQRLGLEAKVRFALTVDGVDKPLRGEPGEVK